jgi:hypothetical protein
MNLLNNNFYKVPSGFFQISNDTNLNCDHEGFMDKKGFTYSNGKTSIIRTCEKCGSEKRFSSYKK